MRNHRFSIRVSGSIESLAQLMVAVSTALSGSWIEQTDSDRGLHFVLSSSPLSVSGRADLAPGAIDLELTGIDDAAAIVSELDARLHRHVMAGVAS